MFTLLWCTVRLESVGKAKFNFPNVLPMLFLCIHWPSHLSYINLHISRSGRLIIRKLGKPLRFFSCSFKPDLQNRQACITVQTVRTEILWRSPPERRKTAGCSLFLAITSTKTVYDLPDKHMTSWAVMWHCTLQRRLSSCNSSRRRCSQHNVCT